MWFNIAAANGDAYALKDRDNVASKMALADILKAQALAFICMNSGYRDCGV